MSEFIGNVCCYARTHIMKNANVINSLEGLYKRPIKIAQKGNNLLVNAGIKTEIRDVMTLNNEEKVIDFITNTCKKNEEIMKGKLSLNA